MLARLRSLYHALRSRRDFEAGITEELRFHMQQYAEELVRSGVAPEEARRRARLEFGAIEVVKEECRGARGLLLPAELGRQIRYAARLLRKTPAFAATALLTVALCLGANLTILAVIDSILLRPLPFPEAQRLVTLFNTYPRAHVERDGSTLTNYYERRGRIPAFSSLSIYAYDTAMVGEPSSVNREQITRVSPDYFTTLGIGPVMGRAFTEQETTFQTDNVVILSDDYWRREFNADPHVIGRSVRVDDTPQIVVGVLPPGFRFLSSEARLYLPLASRPENRGPSRRHAGGNFIQMIARLRAAATLAQAQQQIDAQNASLELDDPQAKMVADAGFRSLVVPLHADHVAAIRPSLLLLQAGVLTLLLIGTVNLANLLLIRANHRAREHAVRQALGASRAHLIGEVLVETTLLTLVGGLLGLAVAAAGIRLVAALGADRLPLGAHIAFDARLAVAAVLAALAMGVALAVPVVWFHLRVSGNALRSESRTATTGRAAQTLRQSFVVAQFALAFVLLAGAGLLGLSVERAMAVYPGFQPDHVLTGQISMVGKKYPSPLAGLAFTERLVDALGRRPGVLSVGVSNNVPFSGGNGKSSATVKGYVLRPGEAPRGIYSYGVGGDYFRAMGFRLLAGRFLTAADSRRHERVCVVDEDFARRYWPYTSPLGQQLFEGSQPGPDSEAFTVVGVVDSVKQAGLTDEAAQCAVYYPYIYRPERNIFLVARASVPTDSLQFTLQRVVREMDSGLAVNDIQNMNERIADSLVARRSPALLAGMFAAIALLLTGIGTYGVLSYAVAQRNREIGVRMALGAQPSQIRTQFLALGLRLVIAGLALGSAGAWVMGRVMQAVLFHVTALRTLVIGCGASVMAVIALVACLVPARRAALVSPMRVLTEQ